MEPRVLYEDEQLLAVDKPSGIIVYPDGKHDYPALSSWLDARYGEGKYFFAHRIDRETSGLLLIAKDEETNLFLKEQFHNREIKKIYRAFVYGRLKDDRGIIEKAIGSARGGLGPRSARRPHGTMRDAVTAWSVRARGKEATYVDVFPKTGRTHQIRVHFAAIQHPIVCDQLYAPSRKTLLEFNRLALHALSLTFEHPNGQHMTLEAPLPDDFVHAEEELRRS
jgi:RluA family pseudouridine synthase